MSEIIFGNKKATLKEKPKSLPELHALARTMFQMSAWNIIELKDAADNSDITLVSSLPKKIRLVSGMFQSWRQNIHKQQAQHKK